MSTTKRKGRPVGSKTKDVPTVIVEPSKCPACKSIGRSPYYNTQTMVFNGTTPTGRTYTKVVWRHCHCLDCNQRRVDKTYE